MGSQRFEGSPTSLTGALLPVTTRTAHRPFSFESILQQPAIVFRCFNQINKTKHMTAEALIQMACCNFNFIIATAVGHREMKRRLPLTDACPAQHLQSFWVDQQRCDGCSRNLQCALQRINRQTAG
jgi:hypothetical protein